VARAKCAKLVDMANIRIDGVDRELLFEMRIRAAGERMTVKDWLLGVIEREVSGETPSDQLQRQGIVVTSPRRRSSFVEPLTAKKQGRKRASGVEVGILPPRELREERTPCRHGLTFHPGCTD
jgi:hypothetical protein